MIKHAEHASEHKLINKQHNRRKIEPCRSNFSTCICDPCTLYIITAPPNTHPTCVNGEMWKLHDHDQAVGGQTSRENFFSDKLYEVMNHINSQKFPILHKHWWQSN